MDLNSNGFLEVNELVIWIDFNGEYWFILLLGNFRVLEILFVGFVNIIFIFLILVVFG